MAGIFEFIAGSDHSFLNPSMAAGKAMLEPAEGIEGSTLLTAMARRGTNFGIQVAAHPGRRFVAPAGKGAGCVCWGPQRRTPTRTSETAR